MHSSVPTPDSQEGAVEPHQGARNRTAPAGGGTNRVPALGRSYMALRPALKPEDSRKQSFGAEVRKPREPGGGSVGVTACPHACVILVPCCHSVGAVFPSLLLHARESAYTLVVVAVSATPLLSRLFHHGGHSV